MTFRSFTSPERLFELLVEMYQMDDPRSLSTEEFEEWKQKKLRPTQKRVLMIFTMWLEDHKLLDEEPHMAQQLTDFLSLIVTPEPLAITARLILESLERLVSNSDYDFWFTLICVPSIDFRSSRTAAIWF
jgi:son of sevenless-like protein